ncbi:MAG TPA: amidohydrolase family protein, partial [Bacteroidales bacterium]|nr:amidohydrolase family protein [Bacteroidales bacterium]
MSKKENVFISGIHYETDEYIEIEISDGFIGEIRCSGKQINKGCETYIAPGLIDSQTNGYLGINFQDELFSVERMRFAAKAIWKDGVTTYVPTLVTESRENLLRNFRILAMAIEDKQLMGCIPGFHLEGPYLSSIQGFYGCHNAKYLRNPSIDEFNELQEAAQGHIIIVTIAPELEGAIEFIKYCSENGVVVSIGHTNATTEQIYRAVDNGARMSTHLGNGCANMINRHRNPL